MAGKSGKRYNITNIDRARIHRLLAKKKWTVSDLAKAVGQDPTATGRIVNGQTQTSPILPEIFHALGVEHADSESDYVNSLATYGLNIWDSDPNLAHDLLAFVSWWDKKCEELWNHVFWGEQEIFQLQAEQKANFDAAGLKKISERNAALKKASADRQRILGAALHKVMKSVDHEFSKLPVSRFRGVDSNGYLPLSKD